MDTYESGFSSSSNQSDEDIVDVRKGPWTVEEDSLLVNYVAVHGEGRWNSVARYAGLKRTGKSCRLRWLNYLRPDVRRGNISLQEQLLILELHSRWGNRWSKIAQHLPGRTDNEIKNYWRTRVQKQAKQLKCDVNSQQFRDTMRYVWMPRLVERIRAKSESSAAHTTTTLNGIAASQVSHTNDSITGSSVRVDPYFMPEVSVASSDSMDAHVSPASDLTDCYNPPAGGNYNPSTMKNGSGLNPEEFGGNLGELDFQAYEQSNTWLGGGESLDGMWNDENVLFLRQQLF